LGIKKKYNSYGCPYLKILPLRNKYKKIILYMMDWDLVKCTNRNEYNSQALALGGSVIGWGE
jgi:hypothetical protein